MNRDEATNMLEMAREAGTHLVGPDAARWMAQLDQEHDRLHAALTWFIEQGRGADALALVAAIWRFWLSGGNAREGSEWMDAALHATGAEAPTSERARATYGAGLLAFVRGENQRSRQLNEESLRVARVAGDRLTEVDAHVGLARVALRDGDYAQVRTHCEDGLAIARELGKRDAEALPLHLLAAATRLEGDYEGARRLYQQTLALNEERGDQRAIVMERINLGAVEALAGDAQSAKSHLLQALRSVRELDVRRYIPSCLVGLANVAVATGDPSRAAFLLGATDAELDATGTTLDPDDQSMYDMATHRAQAEMPAEMFDESRAAGRALPLDEAIDQALSEAT